MTKRPEKTRWYHLTNIAARQLRKVWIVQTTVIILFAAAVVALMLYSSYLARESARMVNRVESRIPNGFLLVDVTIPEDLPRLEAYHLAAVSLTAAWRDSLAQTNLGSLPCTLFANTLPIHTLVVPGTAAIHANLARKLNVQIGDLMTLHEGGRQYEVNVVNIYEVSPFSFGFSFGERLLVYTGEEQKNTSFLYEQGRFEKTVAINYLKRLHPLAEVQDNQTEQSLGGMIVNSSYRGVTQLQIALVMFITLAFLTSRMLSFMDGRKTLAILKTAGLKSKEVAGYIAAEALFTPILGTALGLVTGCLALRVLAQRGTGLALSTSVLVAAVSGVIPAMLVGVFVPSRLARVATVIELLFGRSIPLYHDTVTSITRRYPVLEQYIARGAHFVKLESVDGQFEGIIFRQLGDTVKRGEVIAHGTSWWGLKVTEYVSPLDGFIVYYQQETGVIGIGPEDMLGWAPDSSIPKPRLATASHNT